MIYFCILGLFGVVLDYCNEISVIVGVGDIWIVGVIKGIINLGGKEGERIK